MSDLLTPTAICRQYGLHRATWRRWVQIGVTPSGRTVPQPEDLPGHPRWKQIDIEDFFRGLDVRPGTRRHFLQRHQPRLRRSA